MLFLWWWYTNKKKIDYKSHEFPWFFIYVQKKYQDYSWYSLAEQRGFEPPRPLTNPSSLANCPLQPLGYCSLYYYKKMAERVGFEPTVGYKPTPIFKTGAINQLDHLSISSRDKLYNTIKAFHLSIILCIFLFLWFILRK